MNKIMKKSIFLYLTVIISLVSCCQGFSEEIYNNNFFNGHLIFNLSDQTYHPGDTLSTDIVVYNLEDFPLVDAYLVLEISTGAEHVYPSQFSDLNNVFYESIIRNINLGGKSNTIIPFSYRLPDDLSSGNYLLSVYLSTPRTPVVGIPFIFISPQTAGFVVSGSGNFPYVRINRTKTFFVNETGPVGVGVTAGSLVNGSVHISGAAGSELMLNVTVCSWDDTSCDVNGFFWNREYRIKSTQGEGDILVSFKAPEKPDAYAIRLELFEGGRTLSLYRSRIVVMGKTAKIRKVVIDKASYSSGEDGKVLIQVGASPDHYTRPLMENVSVSLTIKDLERNKEVYSSTSIIPVLYIDLNGGKEPVLFEFKNTAALNNFSVCAKVSSPDMQLDKYCLTIDQAKIKPKIGEQGTLNSSWTYDASKGTLKLNICSSIPGERKAAAILMSNENPIASADSIILTPCGQANIQTDTGKYNLIINDLKSNQQYLYELNLPEEETITTTTIDELNLPEEKEITATTLNTLCGDGICAMGEEFNNCCSDCGCTEGTCSGNICKTTEKPAETGADLNSVYLLLGLALIVVGFLFYIKRKK